MTTYMIGRLLVLVGFLFVNYVSR